MFVYIPLTRPLPITPLERFVHILDGLCAAIAARGAGGVLTTPLLILLWGRLRRMAVRATKAAARLAAGAPQRPARRRPATSRPSRPQTLRLPNGFAWLVPLVPGAAAYGSQLQLLLADPRMAPLAAVPSVRRLLTPLRQMLGVPKPKPSPPPPPAPRPAAVPPRPAPARLGGEHAAGEPPPPRTPDAA